MGQRLRTISFLMVAALAAGCGSDGASEAGDAPVTATPSVVAVQETEPEPEPLPGCGSVWKAEKRLPLSYAGCQQGDAKVVRATKCQNGQVLFLFGSRFYAVPGGPVFRASGDRSEDSRFSKLYRVCTA